MKGLASRKGNASKGTNRIKILFLCTGNSCRSQMAEGWTRHIRANVIEAHSAGIEKHGLNPMAVKAMAEVGVSISHCKSKLVSEFKTVDFDFVIALCGHAAETCPLFPGGVKILHIGFDDPPKLAACANTEEEAMQHYRRVRDEIRSFVESLPARVTAHAAFLKTLRAKVP